jgi:hypothetical protein
MRFIGSRLVDSLVETEAELMADSLLAGVRDLSSSIQDINVSTSLEHIPLYCCPTSVGQFRIKH